MPTITERYGRDAYEFRENSIVVKIPFRWINVMVIKMVIKNLIKQNAIAYTCRNEK